MTPDAAPPALIRAVHEPGGVEALPGSWTQTPTVPEEPYLLHHLDLAWAVRVASLDDARAVLDAAGRGVAVVVELDLGPLDAEEFRDDLARVAVLVEPDGDLAVRIGRLSGEQRALLDALAGGRSLTEAASTVGVARRTALRRLAAAREVLGVTSTTEAVVLAGRVGPNWG